MHYSAAYSALLYLTLILALEASSSNWPLRPCLELGFSFARNGQR